MQQAQDVYGYLPMEVQQMIADGMGVPLEKVYGVATFYAQFSLSPKGAYNISVCLGTACYVKGSGDVFNRLSELLGIDAGECTADGKFSLDRLPLHRRVRTGPGHDRQRRGIRPSDGGRRGRHSGQVQQLIAGVRDAGAVAERAGYCSEFPIRRGVPGGDRGDGGYGKGRAGHRRSGTTAGA